MSAVSDLESDVRMFLSDSFRSEFVESRLLLKLFVVMVLIFVLPDG